MQDLQGSYIEFIGDDLVIVTTQFEGVMMHKINVSELFPPTASTVHLPKTRTVWAGVPVHPDAVVSFGLSPKSRLGGWKLGHINLLSFGQSLYLARIPPPIGVAECGVNGGDNTTRDGPRSATRPAGLTSQESAALGRLGHRAVWLERNWEDEHVRLMKMSATSQGNNKEQPKVMGIKIGVLVPPVPNLPFRPAECRSLAFDEAKGRVVLGLYSGDLCVLDFAEE
jgi:hypothetical protein